MSEEGSFWSSSSWDLFLFIIFTSFYATYINIKTALLLVWFQVNYIKSTHFDSTTKKEKKSSTRREEERKRGREGELDFLSFFLSFFLPRWFLNDNSYYYRNSVECILVYYYLILFNTMYSYLIVYFKFTTGHNIRNSYKVTSVRPSAGFPRRKLPR